MRFSAVVTAHAEGLLLRPTLQSVSAALTELAATGASCELVIQMDGATDETRRQARLWSGRDGLPFEIVIGESSTGDAGSARNAGVALSRGDVVALCDGDDLVSSNYFLDGLRSVEDAQAPTVFHPETLISFGARPSRWLVRSSTSPDLTYRDVLAMNLWPSSSIARRELFQENPHPSLPPADGLGPEDWAWNLETLSRGIVHDVVERSVFFYRTRESGGVNQQHSTSLLPTIDIPALRDRFPLPPPEPAPTGVDRIVRGGMRRVRAVAMPPLRRLPRPIKHVLRRGLGAYRRRVSPEMPLPWRTSEELAPVFAAAAQHDPALSWVLSRYDDLEAWVPRDDGFGAAIDQMLLGLEGRCDALVMIPWIGVGGADLVSQNYLRALRDDPRLEGRVSALATYLPERTRRDMIPDGVNFVQADQMLRRLPPERQDHLFAQLVVWAAPRLVIGVNCFDLVGALRRHHVPLCLDRSVYLTLFAFDQVGDGFPVQPITDDSRRDFLGSITGLITDNVVTKRRVDDMLGLPEGFLAVHPQPAMERTLEIVQQSTGAIVRVAADPVEAPPPTLRIYTAAHDDPEFDEARPFKLLWPHRLDGEKRPDALLAIADEAARRGVPIGIDVYGQRVLSAESGNLLEEFQRRGIDYRGPYSGGLVSLPTTEYHAMLLTSAWEGMPLVVVQSMMLGLPVISTAVGGVPDLVTHRVSGMLVPGPDDADAFVTAIEELVRDRELRRAIIRSAYDAAVDRHSWSRFRELTRDALRVGGVEVSAGRAVE